MRTVGLGRGLLATASASLAVWSLAYGHFAWQSLLARTPWEEIWVYGSALALLAAGAALCLPRAALAGVLTIGAYLAIATALSIPQIFANPLSIGAWYPFCEALTSFVGAWVLLALLRRQSPGPPTPLAGESTVRAAKVLFGLTCVFYGWSHFVYADYTASMVPAWLPSRLALAYLTGLGHVVAGLAIVIGILPRLAANLEATMMSLFGLLVWVPSFFAQPRPKWATPPENQWSELVVTLLLAASAWIVAISFGSRMAAGLAGGAHAHAAARAEIRSQSS
jgi:uncharacterized membrane protein YphA (DoxX/SURF4 family)